MALNTLVRELYQLESQVPKTVSDMFLCEIFYKATPLFALPACH